MKNKNGFTLIELLATIAILGTILTISVVSVTNVISNSKTKSYKIIKNEMIEAAKKYVTENISEFYSNGTISLEDLIESGHIKEIYDPNNTSVKCDGTVNVNVAGNKYKYEASLTCGGKTY